MPVQILGEPYFIFGVVDITEPIEQLPLEAIGYKIKSRRGEFAQIFIRFPDRIEHRYLYKENGILKPGTLIGANQRIKPEAKMLERYKEGELLSARASQAFLEHADKPLKI
jgi:hypothetical protein